jgi:hypothetical protein
MQHVSPKTVLAEVSSAIPEACRDHIVVIGSLAAGYHFFGEDGSRSVRTKDVDCVLEPFALASDVGRRIARQLLDAGWQPRLRGDHQNPGTEQTPVADLPAVRLYPPGSKPDSESAWFLELLTVPESCAIRDRTWTRLELPEGHFGLPTFRFLSVTAFEPLPAGHLGIRYARPEMMALANLLEHPTIRPDRMGSLISSRAIKRSNKDLGRVLAIAALSDLDDYRPWANEWLVALKRFFPHEWPDLARRAGLGLRHLLSSESDLEEAHYTCVNGLLSSQPPRLAALRAAGERILGDAVEALEAMIER